MTPAGESGRTRGLICTVLFMGTLLLFARAWQAEFVNYDDPDYVTANPHVKRGLTAEGIKWAFSAKHASNWHPLTWVSHMLDVSWHGMNPKGHHATSVILHALNAVLAFAAFWRLTRTLWPSALCAAFFAWHPLRVESVAWVAERKDVLSGTFWFLVLWAYATFAERQRERRSGAWTWYMIALIAFSLGLMAKPMLVTLPCVLLLLDLWPLRRFELPGPRKPTVASATRASAGAAPKVVTPATTIGVIVLEKLPFLLLSALSSVVTYRAQQGGGSVTDALTLWQRLENAVVAFVRYIGKFFAPVDLAVLYPHPGDWATRKVVASLVIVVGVSVVAWLMRRRWPWLLVGWLWFVGTLVPVIGIVQVGLQSMADRYTYLPIIGLEIAIIWTITDVVRASGTRRVVAAAAGVLLFVYAIATWRQIGVWQNSFTVFDRAIAVTENNYLAHNNRAIWLCDVGRVDGGIADYRRALAIRPDYPEANNNLGRLLVRQGKAAEAVPMLRLALDGKPRSLEVRNNLANALSDIGQLDEAREHYEKILAHDPQHANALNGLGVVLAMQGKPAEAKARIEASLRISPANAPAHSNLGNVFSMLGQLEQAAEQYRRAVELQPDAHIHAQLGLMLAQLGRREEAIREVQMALRVRPDHAQAKQLLDELLNPRARN